MDTLKKEQILDDEGLVTLMCEAEPIVNGRPITKVSDAPKDLEAFTPNQLLLLRSGPSLPPEIHSRQRWRQIQYLAAYSGEGGSRSTYHIPSRKTEMESTQEELRHWRHRFSG